MADSKALIRWGSQETANRGLLADEVLIFSKGEYSDYSLSRVVMTTRAITAQEIEDAARRTKLSGDGGLTHLHAGDLIDTLLLDGAVKEIKVSEVHTETWFASQGGPALECIVSQL